MSQKVTCSSYLLDHFLLISFVFVLFLIDHAVFLAVTCDVTISSTKCSDHNQRIVAIYHCCILKMHFIIDQGLALMRVESLIAATKITVVFRNLLKRTSGLKMCVTLPLRMFSCVKGERLFVLPPLTM